MSFCVQADLNAAVNWLALHHIGREHQENCIVCWYIFCMDVTWITLS
jgi:hypothetical protein